MLGEVGEEHAGDDGCHGENLGEAQGGQSHQDGGDCGDDGHEVLVYGDQHAAYQLDGGVDHEIGKESRADHHEGYHEPGGEGLAFGMEERGVGKCADEEYGGDEGCEKHPAQQAYGPVAVGGAFKHNEIDCIAEGARQGEEVAQQGVGGVHVGVSGHDYDYGAGEGENDAAQFEQRWARTPEQDVDKYHEHRGKRHDNRHVDGVGVAQREVEKEDEGKEAEAASGEDAREVGAGYAVVAARQQRRQPEKNAASAEAEEGYIVGGQPFRIQEFYHRDVYAEK